MVQASSNLLRQQDLTGGLNAVRAPYQIKRGVNCHILWLSVYLFAPVLFCMAKSSAHTNNILNICPLSFPCLLFFKASQGDIGHAVGLLTTHPAEVQDPGETQESGNSGEAWEGQKGTTRDKIGRDNIQTAFSTVSNDKKWYTLNVSSYCVRPLVTDFNFNHTVRLVKNYLFTPVEMLHEVGTIVWFQMLLDTLTLITLFWSSSIPFSSVTM